MAKYLGGGSVGGASNWDEMLGLDNSPPPPYASLDDNTAVTPSAGRMPPASAPPPSLPSLSPQSKPTFPPDVNTVSQEPSLNCATIPSSCILLGLPLHLYRTTPNSTPTGTAYYI